MPVKKAAGGVLTAKQAPTGPAPTRRTVCAPRGPSSSYRRPAKETTVPRSSFRPQVERLDDRYLPAFLDPVSYAVNTTPHGVVSADFNNDGRSDLAVAANSSPSASVDVLLGNGDG